MPVGLKNIIRGVKDGVLEPLPTRILVIRALDVLFNILSYEQKLNFRTLTRVPYGFGLLHAARQARALSIPAISAIEFGVAGGNGLIALEEHAERVTRETGVAIEIFGFDNGAGLPPPADHRDLPYAWGEGFFALDEAKLRARLTRAQLVIGDVAKTAKAFPKTHPAAPPVGFIAFDLDYYSSTMAAFRLFDALPRERMLPRPLCYFDDVAGGMGPLYGPHAGELLAIAEFNAAHRHIKLSPIAGLRHHWRVLPAQWHEMLYVAHVFDHPRYGERTSGMTAGMLGLE